MTNLKSIRESRNLTQEDLSDLTNIPIGTLRDWEQKTFPKQIIYLIKLKEKLNCTYEDLLKQTEQEKNENENI